MFDINPSSNYMDILSICALPRWPQMLGLNRLNLRARGFTQVNCSFPKGICAKLDWKKHSCRTPYIVSGDLTYSTTELALASNFQLCHLHTKFCLQRQPI